MADDDDEDEALIEALGESLALQLVVALSSRPTPKTGGDVAAAVAVEVRRLVQRALPFASADLLETAIENHVREIGRGCAVDFAGIIAEVLARRPVPG